MCPSKDVESDGDAAEEPATKGDVARAVTGLGAELRAELASKADLDRKVEQVMAAMHAGFAELRTEMHTGFAELRTEMHTELSRHTNAIIEALRQEFRTTDDQYQHLPAAHDQLRADFDAHVASTALHRAPRRRTR